MRIQQESEERESEREREIRKKKSKEIYSIDTTVEGTYKDLYYFNLKNYILFLIENLIPR